MRRRPVLAWCLPIALLVASGCNKKLEHFKFYAVTDGHLPGEIAFRYTDQFRPVQPRSVTGTHLTHFGNPVSKDGGSIENSDHHLTWYQLKDSQEPFRTVWLNHQFARNRTYRIGSPKVLLMPAHKVQGHQPPQGLSHFCCYETMDPRENLDRDVTLKDEFGDKAVTVRLTTADFFCQPIQKYFRDYPPTKIEQMKPPYSYLLVYKLGPSDPPKGVDFKRVSDQVWPGNVLRDFRPVYLAIPSEKPRWEPSGVQPPTPHD